MMGQQDIKLDRNGYFRHESGCPLVCVFDSQYGRSPTTTESSWQIPILGPQVVRPDTQTPQYSTGSRLRPFKFVSPSLPQQKKRSRTLKSANSKGRLHQVVNGYEEITNAITVPKQSPASSTKPCNIESPSNRKIKALQEAWLSCQHRHSFDNLTTYPIAMKADMFTLMDYYLSMLLFWSPLPHSSGRMLLPMAMSDPILFHILLCGAALYKDQISGVTESLEKIKHMNKAIHLLNARFQSRDFQVSDAAIYAVAHLADFESAASNLTIWKIHMEGLRKMVQMTGGFTALSGKVQRKLQRADINGCIRTLRRPLFGEFITLLPPILNSPQNQDLCDGFQEMLSNSPLDSHLVDILYQVQDLASIFNDSTMSPNELDELIIQIQGNLLFAYCNTYERIQRNCIRDLCCITLISFLEAAKYYYYCPSSMRQGMINNSIGGALIQRLKTCIIRAEQILKPPRAFILWASFLGLAAGNGIEHREWFADRLQRSAENMRLDSWRDIELVILTFPWIFTMHSDLCTDFVYDAKTGIL